MRTATVSTQNDRPFVIVYQKRFPIQQRRADGALGCRGCGGVIPKGRQTWCSKACSKKYHPTEVRWAVKERDKDVCSECGFDCAKARSDWESERWHTTGVVDSRKLSEMNGLRFSAARNGGNPSTVKLPVPPLKLPPDFNYSEWRSRKPPPAEYDHIIPFAEVGLTVLENMRTLCEPCHKKRTKLWHAERKIKATPELALTSVFVTVEEQPAPLLNPNPVS